MIILFLKEVSKQHIYNLLVYVCKNISVSLQFWINYAKATGRVAVSPSTSAELEKGTSDDKRWQMTRDAGDCAHFACTLRKLVVGAVCEVYVSGIFSTQGSPLNIRSQINDVQMLCATERLQLISCVKLLIFFKTCRLEIQASKLNVIHPSQQDSHHIPYKTICSNKNTT